MSATNLTDLSFQKASLDIWATKYQLKEKSGKSVDQTITDTYQRIAKALSDVEVTPAKRKKHFKEFMWAIENGAIPAGRIISNAGAKDHKPETSLINCTVSGTIHDSMNDILHKNHEAGLTLKAGCGIGYEFSTLRPKGAYVAGAGATTSGPLSFMDIYDKTCFTVSSAGGRRGAQMGTFDIHHPDVMEFIDAKKEDGRLRQFNLSLLITEDFVKAVVKDDQWILSFPVSKKEVEAERLKLDDDTKFVYRYFPVTEDYILNHEGQVACKIFDTINARDLWNKIMDSTYNIAEPGFILIDKANEMNNAWFCENLRATNPCGEQLLPPYGSCLLGSINLVHMVENPFSKQATINFDKLEKVASIFARMLDNVVEIHGLALENQARELEAKRRHGMGFMGLGSMLTMLGIKYGSDEAVIITEKIARTIAIANWKAALSLSKEKGPAPIMEEEFVITDYHLTCRPEMIRDGYKKGDKVKGKVLHAKYSRYMQQLAKIEPKLVAQLIDHGARYTHATSIAPTGTIALSLGNNVSNGIEPSFAHHYSRNVIREGKNTKEKLDVFSFELLAYRHLINPKALPESNSNEKSLPQYFINADDVDPKQHVEIQAAAQKWVDASISKTVNVATDIAFEEFKSLYLYAVEKGLKGCTTFRFNPEVFQGVLVKEEDLANTTYEFTLDDGTKIQVRGNEEIIYDGETHTAANLFDALKENTYGKVA